MHKQRSADSSQGDARAKAGSFVAEARVSKFVYIGGLLGVALLVVLARQSFTALQFRQELNDAIAALSVGRNDVALADLSIAARINSNEPNVYLYRAMAEMRLNDPAAAMQDFNRCLQLAPHSRAALVGRARLYDKAGSFDAAIADCNAVLALDADFSDARRVRAQAYNHAGKYGEAVRDCDALLAASAAMPDKERAEILAYRGFAYFHSGDFKASAADFKLAARLQPENAQLVRNLDLVTKRACQPQ